MEIFTEVMLLDSCFLQLECRVKVGFDTLVDQHLDALRGHRASF